MNMEKGEGPMVAASDEPPGKIRLPLPLIKWRDRRNLRQLLYLMVLGGIGSTCASIYRMREYYGRTHLFPDVWLEQVFTALISPVMVVVLVVYDRRRIRREDRDGPSGLWVHSSFRGFLLLMSLIWLAHAPFDVMEGLSLRAAGDDGSGNFYEAAIVSTPIACFLWWDRRKVRRERWEKSSCCMNCGYDLRASSDRCPECGTPIPTIAK
jgi:hypothetical protein